ncbi:MAG: T9SS type A sorting domain-containing protein, partial [Flavobacteriales bacterium]|nr:T9SS type A sorting domain-containing protein [Flavobacteriales bacterium]
YPGMTLDENGEPVVVYADMSQGGKASVKRWNGTSWDLVGTSGFSDGAIDHPDIAVDASGVIYVAYSDQSHGFAITVQRFDGTWSVVGLPNFSDGATNFISMDLDALGRPVVSYRDYAHSDGVTVERFNGTNFVEVGAKGFSGGLANYTSLVMDASDNPVVAFADGTAGNKASVMRWDGISSWNYVDAAGISAGAVDHCSMRLDGSGNIYVAYVAQAALGSARKPTVKFWDGSIWSSLGGTSFGSLGVDFVSLALDPAGMPVIACVANTFADRRAIVQAWDGSSWNFVGLNRISATINDEEPGSWLEIDAFGRMTIAYASGTLYARRFGSLPCTDWTLTLRTDGNGSETTFEVIEDGTSAVLASGSGFADNALYTLPVCIPENACFHLVVNDLGGDGIAAPGGWMLQDPFGNRVIDNMGDGEGTWSSAQVGLPTCDPVGSVKLIASDCDREDFLITEFVACTPDPAVSAEWGLGDQTDDGYQFWFFDPEGGYNRYMFRSHAVSGGFGPANATRACHLRLNTMVTLPLPQDTLLNVRIRPRVNGVNGNFGPACRLKVVSVPSTCPTTKLYDLPYDAWKYSCGVTGKVAGASDKIWLIPIVGADKYQWRFEYAAEGFERRIATNNAALVLGTWHTLPLLCGTVNYDVSVRASFDGGSTWCPFGEVCTVEITNPDVDFCTTSMGPGAQPRSLTVLEEPSFGVYPNPATGQDVYLRYEHIHAEVDPVRVQITDRSGRLVQEFSLTELNGSGDIAMPLTNALAEGLYVVQILSGDQVHMDKLVVRN